MKTTAQTNIAAMTKSNMQCRKAEKYADCSARPSKHKCGLWVPFISLYCFLPWEGYFIVTFD